MPGWAWIIIAVGVVVLIGVALLAMARQRSARLRERFGPEYDRAVASSGGRRKAESELEARRKRREELDIHPLDPAARLRYTEQWNVVQARFVDDPGDAVAQADALVLQVMRDRGYPMDEFDQRAADISVDHPNVVQNYRAAHAISAAHGRGEASTEDLRQAVVHYRALFAELLGEDAQPDREAR